MDLVVSFEPLLLTYQIEEFHETEAETCGVRFHKPNMFPCNGSIHCLFYNTLGYFILILNFERHVSSCFFKFEHLNSEVDLNVLCLESTIKKLVSHCAHTCVCRMKCILSDELFFFSHSAIH
jgi:hypothetical protein